MANIFKDYAKIFDIIYREKNYKGECGFLKKIFKKYSKRPVLDILDIACGTGNHIIPLAKSGYCIYAQDISAEMLKIAKRKSRNENLRIKFMGCYPMQKFWHRKKFDAVIAMFSSIDYVIKLKELKDSLRNIRDCLKEDGLFIFDFWNKDCVVRHFSPIKKKVIRDGKEKIIRVSKTRLNKESSVANVNFICDYFVDGKHVKKIKGLHKMKYYDVTEMKRILHDCGFKVLGAFPFMHFNKKISNNDWNISIVATPLV